MTNVHIDKFSKMTNNQIEDRIKCCHIAYLNVLYIFPKITNKVNTQDVVEFQVDKYQSCG